VRASKDGIYHTLYINSTSSSKFYHYDLDWVKKREITYDNKRITASGLGNNLWFAGWQILPGGTNVAELYSYNKSGVKKIANVAVPDITPYSPTVIDY